MISELNLPFSNVKDANITSDELIKILNLQTSNINNKQEISEGGDICKK